jgi:hypothetical protein
MFLPVMRSTSLFPVSGSVHAKLQPAGVLDELKLRFNSSKTPAGSNLREHYKILEIQSSAHDGQKHRPKHVEPTWNN